MEEVLLEKPPRIAVYSPPNMQPWDDAVTLALTYAEVPYDVIYDEEVLAGKLDDYDWLHLHHEDFTGQYGKFYASFGLEPWYLEQKHFHEELAASLGFDTVWQLKHAVAATIRDYVEGGGFLFAMCSATDTIDIALAWLDTDIVPAALRRHAHRSRLPRRRSTTTRTFAFQDFKLMTNPHGLRVLRPGHQRLRRDARRRWPTTSPSSPSRPSTIRCRPCSPRTTST